MTLEEVRAAYEATFGDVSKFSIYIESGNGRFFATILMFLIVIIALYIVTRYLAKRDGLERDGVYGLEFVLIGLFSCGIFALLTMSFPAYSFYKNPKDDLIVHHPDYETYKADYVIPYLITLPEEQKYENLIIVPVEESGAYLTYANVNRKSIEESKHFDISDLEYVLIKDNQSSYISEVALKDDLGGEFKVGYEKHVAYINEADKQIIEEYLGSEIELSDFGKDMEEERR